MNRGFQKISKKQFEKENKDKNIKYENITIPERKTKNSAGYDFYSPIEKTIKSKETYFLPTYIKSYMKNNEYLMIIIRSSIAIKNSLTLTNQVGIIDSDYYNNKTNEGHIFIAITNNSDKDYKIEKNDRIAQGIFTKYYITDDDNQKQERKGGLGSTNKEES